MKEKDLIYELGRQNWIDSVAGEAVVLGFSLRVPALEIAGTELARLIKEIPYNSDEFAWVIAKARGLENQIRRTLEKKGETVYMDEIYHGESLARRNSWSWEYDLLFVRGRYQIWMVLPVYGGKQVLLEEKKKKAEAETCNFFGDPSFESYEKQIVETDHVTQKYLTTSFIDRETGKLLRKITDHDHEGCNFSGWHEIFYFDDFQTAWNAWQKVKKVVS